MKPDIIFIGAGPIGLLTAIQVQLLNPNKKILMFEKYEKPIRNHAMYVDKGVAFAGMDRSNGFGDILDSIPPKVIISDLEIKLRGYAEKIGIQIEYKQISDVNKLVEEYPDTQYLVGSDGLRGIIHPQVFNSEKQVEETLRYAAEVKYKAEGKGRTLNKLTELPGVLSYTKHLVSEYVGHEKQGVTPVSLRIFVSEETYNDMKEATFKNPYKLSDTDKVDPDLLNTINIYLSARNKLTNEVMKKENVNISMITLSIYASRFFYKQVKDKVIFQIGEEAFACPFYRSFNDNAYCVQYFTTTMTSLFNDENVAVKKIDTSFFTLSSLSKLKHEESPLEFYHHNIQKLINSEIKTIHAIDFGIDLVETSVASSRAVPSIPRSKLKLSRNGKTFIDEVNDNAVKKSKDQESVTSNKFSCNVM